VVKVLVVEDDQHIRELMMRILTDDGYQVIEAANGSEAVERARDSLPEPILLDVEMPVLHGFDALKRLRRQEATKSIPVVMVTVLAPLSQEQDAMRMGVGHYLPKPWSNDMLRATIRVALRDGRSVAVEQADASQLGGSSDQEEADAPRLPFIASGNNLIALDQILGGGIPLGTLTFLEGTSGAGKSVLCRHLTVGAVYGGHRVAYFASQHDTESLISQMASIGPDVSDDVEEDKLCVYPVERSARDEDSGPFLAILAEHIEILVSQYNFVIADAITNLAETSGDREIISLYSNCKRLCPEGRTIILVADPYAFHVDAVHRLRPQCDTQISLRAETPGKR